MYIYACGVVTDSAFFNNGSVVFILRNRKIGNYFQMSMPRGNEYLKKNIQSM